MSDANVIRLPTAAKRRVQQPPNHLRRALAGHLEECPAEYVQPWVRDMTRQREGLQGGAAETMKDDAALLIAVYLVAHVDPILRAKVFGSVAHWNRMYKTPETGRALLLVEALLKGLPMPPAPSAPPGAA